MPELTSECPTDEELKQYLDEHWQGFDEVLDEKFDFDCHAMFQIFYDAVFKALIRLNEFPRENEFWHNTNRKPTIYKLHEFCDLIYKENPNDITVLWAKIGLAVRFGGSDSEFSQIVEKLVKFGEMKAETVIDIELFEFLIFGGDESHFAGKLRKLNLVNEARLKLQSLQKSADKTVSEWAAKVFKEVEKQ